MWATVSLQDFSDTEAARLWAIVDPNVTRGRQPATRVELRVEARISVKALAKAFVRTTGNPSSDPPIPTPQSCTRTNQLL